MYRDKEERVQWDRGKKRDRERERENVGDRNNYKRIKRIESFKWIRMQLMRGQRLTKFPKRSRHRATTSIAHLYNILFYGFCCGSLSRSFRDWWYQIQCEMHVFSGIFGSLRRTRAHCKCSYRNLTRKTNKSRASFVAIALCTHHLNAYFTSYRNLLWLESIFSTRFSQKLKIISRCDKGERSSYDNRVANNCATTCYRCALN